MRFIESLLEFADFLGDIFQGLNSFSLGNGITESEKRKAVGQYLGGFGFADVQTCDHYNYSKGFGCGQLEHGTQG